MSMISVLIADDHELIRKGLVSLFKNSDVKVCGEAASDEEAVRQARKLKPDVVLLDVRFGEADGLDSIRRMLTAVENGGAGRSKMAALGGVGFS